MPLESRSRPTKARADNWSKDSCHDLRPPVAGEDISGKIGGRVEEPSEEVVITRSGRPVAVVLSWAKYEGLLETLEVLGDRELSKQIELGLKEATSGMVLSHEEV